MLTKETSERSKRFNKAEQKIKSFRELTQVEFEGISTRGGKVTCLIDRGLTDQSIADFLETDPMKQIVESEPFLNLKNQIAVEMNIPWIYVVYSYLDKKCLVYNISSRFTLEKSFESFNDFGDWFSEKFTDKTEFFSSFQESGLPMFDILLRKNGTPWPGNIDGMLFFSDNEKRIAIVEYQNTSRVSVRDHDNNNFIRPTRYRKGDSKRWKVHQSLSELLDTPVIVIVWSTKEDTIGLKPIKHFDIGNDGYVSFINWGECIYTEIESLTLNVLLSSFF